MPTRRNCSSAHEPRDPTSTILYGISRDHFETFRAHAALLLRTAMIRRLDRPEFTEVPDSVGVNHATFSPDGGSVAFASGSGAITLFSLADQQRKVLMPAADVGGAGLVWSTSGIIHGYGGALWIVPADGGTIGNIRAVSR